MPNDLDPVDPSIGNDTSALPVVRHFKTSDEWRQAVAAGDKFDQFTIDSEPKIALPGVPGMPQSLAQIGPTRANFQLASNNLLQPRAMMSQVQTPSPTQPQPQPQTLDSLLSSSSTADSTAGSPWMRLLALSAALQGAKVQPVQVKYDPGRGVVASPAAPQSTRLGAHTGALPDLPYTTRIGMRSYWQD